MSQILTNNKHYSDIADTIRQMKEVNTTYKPREMSSALKDIYSNEVEGVLPLSFESNGLDLLNYRIDGASGGVGDKTSNLFINVWFQGGINSSTGIMETSSIYVCSDFIPITPLITYSCSRTVSREYNNLRCYDANKQYVGTGGANANTGNPLNNGVSFGTFMITNESVAYIRFNDKSNDLTTKYMLVEGEYTASTMPDYEPYGYKIPVVLSGKNIYNNELYPLTEEQLIYGSNGTTAPNSNYSATLDYIPISEYAGQTITLNKRPGGKSVGIAYYNQNYEFISGTKNNNEIAGVPMTSNVPANAIYMRFTVPINATNIQIELEPTITNIYLNTPIEENESISLSDTGVDISTIEGTNTLTIDTTVQPSNVYIQARKDPDEVVNLIEFMEEWI